MTGFSVTKLAVSLMAVLSVISHPLPERLSGESGQTNSRHFNIGERLQYVIKWDPPWYLFFLPAMEAGELEMQIQGEAEYGNQKALKISFGARSSGTLVKLAGVKVEDTFIVLTDPESFCTFSVSKKIHEGKRRRQIDVEYLRETNRLHFREIDEAAIPSKIKKDEFLENIPSCVQDPLSALYSLRSMELRNGFGKTFVVGHDSRIKEIRVQAESQDKVETQLGNFDSWRINTAALMGGLFKDGGQLTIWLSADDRKLPVQFEVKTRLGRVVGKLKAMS